MDLVWESVEALVDHFHLHGRDLGSRTVDEYDASARETIDVGACFYFEDRSTRLPRIGYYDHMLSRLTVVDEDMEEIVTHFRCHAGYVRDLPRSDYGR